jgi:ATP-dependent DNA helicase DinG
MTTSASSLATLGRRLSVADVLGPDGLLASVHSAWESREGQVHMAERISLQLRSGGTLAVEAPTGIGKTLAYLVPAILLGRRVVISTNTKTLQEQIVAKDLPLLHAALAAAGLRLEAASADADLAPSPDTIRYALMKGRGNYLCLDRLDRRTRQREFAELGVGRREEMFYRSLRDWSLTSQSGDKAELKSWSEDLPLWSEVDARAEICHGSRCARFDECFVVRMRRAAENADIVVVNHHLLLADLALTAKARLAGAPAGFGSIIPRGRALVIDEAHALEEIASEYFGGSVSTHALERFERDARDWLVLRPPAFDVSGFGAVLQGATAAARRVFSELPSEEGRIRVPTPAAPVSAEAVVVLDDELADLPWYVTRPVDPEEKECPSPERFEKARASLPDAVGAMISLARMLEDGPQDPMCESLARRARELGSGLGFILEPTDPDYVYFVERKGRHVSAGAAPIEVAELLSEHLFGAFESVVLTSATLSVDGSDGLGFYLGRVGAPKSTESIVLPSPFDFARQAAIHVPSDLPHPDDVDFPDRLAERARVLIDLVGGGAFLLFTSHRMMEKVHQKLAPELDYPVFIQGQAPKQALLEGFVRETPAVLFGTSSFWEGVDVPGDPLRLVLIDRLPFASPRDPVVAARLERLELQGQSPFATYQVPQAILRLKQAFGRLVRTRFDSGLVVICDRRLLDRRYGQRFLRALPPARRLHHHDDLHHFQRR